LTYAGIGLKHYISIITYLVIFASFTFAADIDDYLIDRLLSMSGPGAPEIIEDSVIFTFSSQCRRAGISFAHEGFSRVYWFRLLLIPQDPINALLPASRKKPESHKDSSILFHTIKIPEELNELEYRLIIDGLWTIDPANPQSRRNIKTGLEYSVLELPARQKKPGILMGPPGTLNFTFQGPPGETVSVAGTFNGWDPFMYILEETSIGIYKLTIPLPPGKYQYIFFCRGERYTDQYNPNRAYSREGKTVSEAFVQ
jgi:hypothetical protein